MNLRNLNAALNLQTGGASINYYAIFADGTGLDRTFDVNATDYFAAMMDRKSDDAYYGIKRLIYTDLLSYNAGQAEEIKTELAKYSTTATSESTSVSASTSMSEA